MSITMRGTVRTTARTAVRTGAVTLGGLALALGAAACSGGDEGTEPTTEEPAVTEETSEPAEETSEEPSEETSSEPAASDGGGEAPGEEELTAAKERFIDFLQVIDDSDYEAACGFTLDPGTGQPPTGESLSSCAESLESEMSGVGTIQPGTFDAVDASMVGAEPNEDGTVTLTIGADQFPLPMIEHTDGQWYFTLQQ